MRVLYIHQYFATRDGSIGTRSYEMSRALVERGHDVHMICGSTKGSNTGLSGEFVNGRRSGMVDGIEVTELEIAYSNYANLLSRAWLFARFALSSIRIALTDPADLVFATSTPLTAGIPGIAARVLRRRRFVFEVRDLWPEIPKAMGVVTNPIVLQGMSILEWASYRASCGCIGLSPGIVEGIQKRSRTGHPVALVPNGCDLDLFDPESVEAAELDGFEEQDFIAVFTGAHGVANGLDAVLDCAAWLQSAEQPTHAGVNTPVAESDGDGAAAQAPTGRRIRFLLVGDGKRKPALVERAKQEKLDNVTFMDPVPKTALAAIIARADVCLMVLDNIPAFYRGTSPNKFFDYLSAGKPIVTNYPGWVVELLTEHGAGEAVPPGQADRFAQAILSLSNDPDRLLAAGKASRALAQSEFSRQQLADRFVDFLEARASVN